MKSLKIIGVVGLISLAFCWPTVESNVSGSGRSSRIQWKHGLEVKCEVLSPWIKQHCCPVVQGSMENSFIRGIQMREPHTVDIIIDIAECIYTALERVLQGDFRFPSTCCKIEIFNQIKALCPYKHLSAPRRPIKRADDVLDD